MTVAELIEKLKKAPQNYEVYCWDGVIVQRIEIDNQDDLEECSVFMCGKN